MQSAGFQPGLLRGHMFVRLAERDVLTPQVRRCVPDSHRRIYGYIFQYLGRQVVSRPGGRERMWSHLGVWGALRAPLAGPGAEPQSKSNLVPFSLKIWHVPTISIIFLRINWPNFARLKLNSKDKSGQKFLLQPIIQLWSFSHNFWLIFVVQKFGALETSLLQHNHTKEKRLIATWYSYTGLGSDVPHVIPEQRSDTLWLRSLV